jgi:hypothetical protein
MDDGKKQKLAAAGKIGFGALKIGSGVMMATGHGLYGAWARKTHHMSSAMRMGANSVESGSKHIKAGIAQWKQTDS